MHGSNPLTIRRREGGSASKNCIFRKSSKRGSPRNWYQVAEVRHMRALAVLARGGIARAMEARGWSGAGPKSKPSAPLPGLQVVGAVGLALVSLCCSSGKHSSLANRAPDAGTSVGGSAGATLVVGNGGASVSLNVDASAPSSTGGSSWVGLSLPSRHRSRRFSWHGSSSAGNARASRRCS